jgi:ABC-type thiamin/hydroxymethylpyrimidine transport system permease subunit
MKAWPLKIYLLAAMLAALTFALAFALGIGLIVSTGIPATGGIANIFVAVTIMIIGVKLVPRFGFATLTIALVFLFAVPTVIGGPPGPQKILNGLAIGLTADIILAVGRRTRWAHIVAGSIGAVVSIVSIYLVMLAMSLPGVDRLAPLLLPLTAVQAILGALAAWLAVILYEKRLANLSAVKRLAAD